ncbi:hypothetical protein OG21DRAFT_815131 [Imleria badia]|nr:hypothetical protein OG21DRAFT_815131 [Imleria badia]
MRVFKQICLSCLLFLALPTRGASLGSGGTDVGERANHEVTKDSAVSPDTIKAASEPSFLTPSYIFEGIQSNCTPKPTLFPILILLS